MNAPAKTLEIRTSPHIISGYSVENIMFNVVWALLPTAAFGILAFGISGALTLLVSTGSCVLAEHLICRGNGRPTTVGDGSVVITGLLYGLTLPPGLPLWMNALGGFVAVGLGKAMFGGLGKNPFNPALVGRAVLQAAFPVSMTSWVTPFAPDRFTKPVSSLLALPFGKPVYDAVSGATPLSAWKFGHEMTGTRELAFGFTSGSVGETSALLILLGGAYLVARNMMNWRIPAAMLGTVAVMATALHAADPVRYAGPGFMLFSGGLMLGAVFMATDMVASPLTSLGAWIYGALIGALVVVIRVWGGMPEGVMYAILLGNAVSPQLDRMIRPRVYGTTRGRKKP